MPARARAKPTPTTDRELLMRWYEHFTFKGKESIDDVQEKFLSLYEETETYLKRVGVIEGVKN